MVLGASAPGLYSSIWRAGSRMKQKYTVHWRSLTLVSFTVLVAMPIRLWFPLGPFSTMTMLDIALWSFAVGVLLFSSWQQLYLGPQPLFLALGIPVGMALLSLLWSVDTLSTIKMVLYTATSLVGYWVTINLCRHCSSEFIAGCMGLFIVLVVSTAILYWFQIPFTWSLTGLPREALDFDDPYEFAVDFARLNSPYLGRSNDFATTLALYVLFFMGVAQATSRKRHGVFACVAALGILLTLSRGVTLAMVGMIALAFCLRLTMRKVAVFSVILSVLAVPTYFFVQFVEQTGIDIIQSRQDPRELYSRFTLFSAALELIEEAPLLGHGGGRHLTNIELTIHNTYFEQWTAYGLLFGSVVILALLSLPWLFWHWTRKLGPAKIVGQHTGLAILIFLLACIVETSNEAAIPSLMFRLFLGWAVAYLHALQREQGEQTHVPRGAAALWSAQQHV